MEYSGAGMREAMRIQVKMNTQELAVVVGVGMGSAVETGMTEGAYYARLRVVKELPWWCIVCFCAFHRARSMKALP